MIIILKPTQNFSTYTPETETSPSILKARWLVGKSGRKNSKGDNSGIWWTCITSHFEAGLGYIQFSCILCLLLSYSQSQDSPGSQKAPDGLNASLAYRT